MLFIARTHLASLMADLARDRLRLDRLESQRRRVDFFPLRKRIPRETKSLPAAVLRCAAAARVRRRSSPAFRSPSRPRWSRARKQQKGEATWLISVLSRRPATIFR